MLLNVDNPLKPKHSPYLYHFGRSDIEWAIFGTLTFSNSSRRNPSDRIPTLEQARIDDFKQLINLTLAQYGLKGKHLAFYRVREHNLAWGCHYHFIVARNRLETINLHEMATFMQDLWEHRIRPFDRETRGIGEAKVLPYDDARELAGVKYCLELEKDEHQEYRERWEYQSPALKKLLINGTICNRGQTPSYRPFNS